MPLFFRRLVVGYPKPRVAPPDTAQCWKIYQVCDEDADHSSWAIADVKALESLDDIACARRCLIMLFEKARSGLPFEKLYDKKQCHVAFEFKHKHRTYEVHRVRGSVSRVYFIYRPHKVVVVVKILAKREDKLTEGEISEITDRAILVIDQLDKNSDLIVVV